MVGTDEAIYCDPPYLPASETANFTQYHTEPFTESHHRQLAADLLEVNRNYGAQVVISNSDTETTREIYHCFRLHEINVQRSVSTDTSNRQRAKEVIGTLGLSILEEYQADCGNCESCGQCAEGA